MSRRESRQVRLDAQRELEVIDAALREEPVAAEHDRLAAFVRAVRSVRPLPSEPFAQELDVRAGRNFGPKPETSAGFPSSSLRPERRGDRQRGRRSVLARPALGIAAAAIVAAAVIVPLSISGGGQRHAQEVNAARAPLAPVTSAPALSASGAPTPRAQTGNAYVDGSTAVRHVERNATLEVGVAASSIQSDAQRVFALASSFGGYVRESSVSSGAAGEDGASFDLRLPSGNVAAAIAALSRLGHVRSQTDQTHDVTGAFDALRRSLEQKRAVRASVLRELAKASEARVIAALRARLRGLEAGISRGQSALRRLTARIDYTSLALSLTPEASAGAASGDLTPGGAARDAARILDAALAVLVIAAAALLPLTAAAIAGWMLVAATRRRLREQALDAG
jgi:hypothetical protein